MPPKVQKSKEAKMLAAMSASKGKGKKKKWSKGKMREKKVHAVVYDPALWEKAKKEVPKRKIITVYSLVEQFKINGSLARRTIRELAAAGQIRPVSMRGGMVVYTKSAAAEE